MKITSNYNLSKTQKSETIKKTIKERSSLNFKAVLISFVIFLAFYLPFAHFSFDKLTSWQPYSQHYKTYDVILDNFDEARQKALNQLQLKNISIDEYINTIGEIETEKKNNLASYYTKKKVLKKEYSFLGYSSFRYFLFAIGIAFFSLVSSIFILVIVLNPNIVKVNKKVFLLISLGFVYTASFWFFRFSLTRTDFPSWSYNISYIITALLATIICYQLTKLFTRIKNKKAETQKELEELVVNGNELVNLLKTS